LKHELILKYFYNSQQYFIFRCRQPYMLIFVIEDYTSRRHYREKLMKIEFL